MQEPLAQAYDQKVKQTRLMEKRLAELEAALAQALGELKEGFPRVAIETIARALKQSEET